MHHHTVPPSPHFSFLGVPLPAPPMRLLQVPRRHLSCSSLKSTASYFNSAPATSPRLAVRIRQTLPRDKNQILPQTQSRTLARTAVMSYSNTDTGSKPADPYVKPDTPSPLCDVLTGFPDTKRRTSTTPTSLPRSKTYPPSSKAPSSA